MKKQIPILFTTDMVKSILAGLKSMTRRLSGLKKINENPDQWRFVGEIHPSYKQKTQPVFRFENIVTKELLDMQCPYGQPGDILWVRENWQLTGWSFEDGSMTVKFQTGEMFDCQCPDPTEDLMWLLNQVESLENGGYLVKDPNDDERFVFTDKKQPFKPSIHMPKDACRIWHEVISVRVERLKDITEQDAIAEGVERHVPVHGDGPVLYKSYQFVNANPFTQAVSSFRTLIESINGTEIWDKNPWVWVVGFKILSTTGKPSDI